MGNHQGAIEDASRAVDIFSSSDAADKSELVKALARRGAALLEMGLTAEALGEIQAASEAAPDNKDLKRDVQKLEEMLREEESREA